MQQTPPESADYSEPEPSDATPSQERSHIGTIVVKIGGSTLDAHDTTLQDLVALQREGVQPIVVHGGGKTITEWMEKQGVRPKFVRGLRVTDEASLEIVVAVLTGLINKQLVSAVVSMGGKAVGLSGADGGMLSAEVLDPELGYVGAVTAVDVAPINAAIAAGYMPIIAPVAVDVGEQPGFLNVNADTAAGEIAAAVSADRLVFMTDVEGVLDSSKRLIPRVTERMADRLMTSNIIAGGMIPKIGACLRNVGDGRSTHIVDGRLPHILEQILDGEQLGTRIG